MLPPKKDDQKAEQKDVPIDGQDDQGEKPGGEVAKPDQVAQADRPDEGKTKKPEADGPAEEKQADQSKDEPAEQPLAEDEEPQSWVTLGSFAADSPYRLLITLTNRGAAVERVELVERGANGQLRYRDLTASWGYLGAQCKNAEEGCQVRAVGDGTPAAVADSDADGGLQVGDFIVSAGETRITRCSELDEYLATTSPGDTVQLEVKRTSGDESQTINFNVTLAERPLELIQPESDLGSQPVPSFLTGIHSIGNDEARFNDVELGGVASLRSSTWKMEKDGQAVIFRKMVNVGDDPDGTRLEFVKRFQLAQLPADQSTNHDFPGYHLEMNLEIWNRGKADEEVAYRVDGPNGLPLEGWWFSYKTHPSWGSAGARDVIWRVNGSKRASQPVSDPEGIEETTGEPGDALAW